MNYYAFHIGDYSSATMHLTWDEDLAYRRLMDVYYMREAPLPADRKQVYRLARATSAGQRKAIDTVLNEFFTLTDDGFKNERCDDELATVADKSRKAKSSAEARWRNANADATASENAMRTHSEGNAPNPNPNPNPNVDVIRGGREPLADLEVVLRQAAGWENQPAPNLCVTGQIQALIDSGAVLEQDVLPVIRSLAPRVRSPTSWNYFIKPIAQARDDRIGAATIVSPPQTGGQRECHPTRQAPRSFVEEALAAGGLALGEGGEIIGRSD